MNILCIETSASLCSVALLKDEETLYLEDSKAMAHAEVLMDLIKNVLKKGAITIKELNAVAFSGGPGSYTGLRIGCSSAKGICYALGIPFIAIDTLKIVAYAARKKHGNYEFYWAMTDARRMEVYHAPFDRNLTQVTPSTNGIITDSDFVPEIIQKRSVLLCGDGATKAVPLLVLNDAKVIANASAMCELAKASYLNGEFADVAYYEPFYLKQANITVSKS